MKKTYQYAIKHFLCDFCKLLIRKTVDRTVPGSTAPLVSDPARLTVAGAVSPSPSASLKSERIQVVKDQKMSENCFLKAIEEAENSAWSAFRAHMDKLAS